MPESDNIVTKPADLEKKLADDDDDDGGELTEGEKKTITDAKKGEETVKGTNDTLKEILD